MMVWECMSTCYVLFRIVEVPASDPKDTLASDEITNLWVKLCNLCRV
jgi:hypothetical protein